MIRTCLIYLQVFSLFIFWGCSGNQSNNNQTDTGDNSESSTDQKSTPLKEEEEYYKISFNKNSILPSSAEVDGLDFTSAIQTEGVITRVIKIQLYESLSDQYIIMSFIGRFPGDHPKMTVGTFEIMEIGQDQSNKQQAHVMYATGNIVTERYYEEAKKLGLLERLENSYLLIKDQRNEINVLSVSDTQSDKENHLITPETKHGQQTVKGKIILQLKNLASGKTDQFNASFEVIHDWAFIPKQ